MEKNQILGKDFDTKNEDIGTANEPNIEKILARRQFNIDLILGDEGREDLPRNLISKIDKIQKLLGRFKSLDQHANQNLVKEVKSMNLKRYTSEVAESISKTDFSFKKDVNQKSGSSIFFSTDLDIIVEI